MPLDEIWRIVNTPDSLTPFWAERRLDSPLASIAGPVNDADPISQATLRCRYRTDIQSGDSLSRHGDGRAWTVGETLEVGRRKWLDMAVATYPVEGAIIVDPTPDMPDPTPPTPDYVPPTGWGITVNGAPLQTLTLATAAGDASESQWDGLFEAIADATGTIESAMLHLGSGNSGPLHMAAYVVRTGNFCQFDFYADLLVGTSDVSVPWEYYDLQVFDSTSVLVRSEITSGQIRTRTQHPLFVGEEIRLVTMAQYEVFAGRA